MNACVILDVICRGLSIATSPSGEASVLFIFEVAVCFLFVPNFKNISIAG